MDHRASLECVYVGVLGSLLACLNVHFYHITADFSAVLHKGEASITDPWKAVM